MQTVDFKNINHVADYPFQDMPYKEPQLEMVEDNDGCIILSSATPLCELEKSIAHMFKKQASAFPSRVWLAEKTHDGNWRECTYGDFDKQSDMIAQWLLEQGLNDTTPMMILSENSISHGLMIMAAMKARVPVASISAPYSLMDQSLQKLKAVEAILQPKIIFAQCGERYKNALQFLNTQGCILVVEDNPSDELIAISDLSTSQNTEAVAASMDKIDGATIAKYMFTSGSTGTPKCVVQTQQILCAQVAGIKSVLKKPDDKEYAPISLQWMPWSHVSAGNIAYHEAIMKGGAIYIDDGKPIPGLFEKTLDNLRSLSTSVFGSAPLGLSWLATALEKDLELQKMFFAKLEAIAYGGSALPDDVARRLQILAIANTGKRIPIISMYGSTETQGVTGTYWPTDLPGVIGLPMPGIEVKLVPCGQKLEVRAKGPTVLDSYYQQEALTRSFFDEQGYFKLGDAARFADPNDRTKGLVFDGRISEDFKLLSGTWVSNLNIKSNLMEVFGRLVRDTVILGENREFVSAFAWLDKQAVEKVLNSEELSIKDLFASPAVKQLLQQHLTEYNNNHPGSSNKVRTLMILSTPPSMGLSEINEKGYINRQCVIDNRAHLVEKIYASDDLSGVIFEPFN